MRAVRLMAASTALLLAFCHPTDRPPVPPPAPTNPTALAMGDVIDASIVSEGSVGWDGGGFDAGVGAQPAP
jgi:hypothetical protein